MHGTKSTSGKQTTDMQEFINNLLVQIEVIECTGLEYKMWT